MPCVNVKWGLYLFIVQDLHLTHCNWYYLDPAVGFTWWAAKVGRVYSGHHLHLRPHVLRQLHEGLSPSGCLSSRWQETQDQDGHLEVQGTHRHMNIFISIYTANTLSTVYTSLIDEIFSLSVLRCYFSSCVTQCECELTDRLRKLVKMEY